MYINKYLLIEILSRSFFLKAVYRIIRLLCKNTYSLVKTDKNLIENLCVSNEKLRGLKIKFD